MAADGAGTAGCPCCSSPAARRTEKARHTHASSRSPRTRAANINASSAALVRGDLELAWVCLGRVRENPLAANNLGVYHWLCGKIGEAEAYFEKARATDPQRAAYNLEQLRKWKEEFGDEAEAGIDNVSEYRDAGPG